MQTFLGAGITTKGKFMPIFPWIGPAYIGCKGGDCSMEKDPDGWQGSPRCDLPLPDRHTGAIGPCPNPAACIGWQLCPALGFGQLMALLPNSSTGMQWSERWQQPFFSVPPGVYRDPRTNASGSSATIFIDNGTSLRPKYQWAVREWGGFGIWTADAAGAELKDSGGAAGRAMWGAIPSPYSAR